MADRKIDSPAELELLYGQGWGEAVIGEVDLVDGSGVAPPARRLDLVGRAVGSDV